MPLRAAACEMWEHASPQIRAGSIPASKKPVQNLRRGGEWKEQRGVSLSCWKAPSAVSVDEKNREGANIVTPKKRRPLNLGLIGRQKRYCARVPGGKNRHEGGYIFG